MDTLINILIGFVVALIVAGLGILLWRQRRKPESSGDKISIHASIQKLKAIGQLSVFKVLTKEIVTEIDHSWGEIGKKYLSWVLSGKKMAMIFEFEIDFRYDLRSAEFEITESDGTYTLSMPPCLHETSIRDIQFYDEQKSKLIPWLLPDLINSIFVDGFSEQDRNKLKDAARKAAEAQAESMVISLSSDVEQSARQTLKSLARAFGAENVRFEFPHEGRKANWTEELERKPSL